MTIVLWITYLTGLLLVVTLFSFIKLFQVDPDDHHYSTDDLFIIISFAAIFWPLLLLLKPSYFIQGKELFKIDNSSITDIIKYQKNRLNELEKMAGSPPLCGRVIQYHHRYIYDEPEKLTNILFNSADVETFFKGKDLPLPNPEENIAIISWIKNRDETYLKTTLIPEQINFEYMAIDLINNGFGKIECTECNRHYPASSIFQHRPELHSGWNTESYRCPEGHTLIRHDWIHMSMKQ